MGEIQKPASADVQIITGLSDVGSAVTTCWKPGSWAELALNQAPRKFSSTSATILLCDPKQATSSLCGFLPYFLTPLISLFAARTSPSLECVFSESHLGLSARFRHWCLIFPTVLWAETLWDHFSDASWRAVVANWGSVYDEESTCSWVCFSLEWTLA